MTARESDLFSITSMITDRIGRRQISLLWNHKNYSFREKKDTQVMKEKICLGLNANEIKIPYDKHLKVSSLAFTVTLKYAVLTGSLALSIKKQ